MTWRLTIYRIGIKWAYRLQDVEGRLLRKGKNYEWQAEAAFAAGRSAAAEMEAQNLQIFPAITLDWGRIK